MPVPSPRNKILPARGNYADLAAEVASIADGEICYAVDQDQYYQNESGTLVAVGATKAQGLLADSAVQPGDNVSDLVNDAGYITAAQVPADSVTSVNTQTGAVVLDADDISDASTTNKYTTAADITKLAGIEGGATADQTGAEIKAAYEAEADTNAFTDAEKTKLSGIAAGAEVNLVTSVAGKTGAVVLSGGDVGLSSTDDLSEGSTNLYSQWSAATGGINYASGNVGINTTSPSAALHVATSADNGGLVLHKTSIAGSTGAKLSYQLTNTGSSAVEIASIKSDQVNATAGNEEGNLLFSTTNSGSASEKMRIDSSGRLLVGTSSASTLRTNIVPKIQTETTSATENGISLFSNVNSASAPFLIFGKSRGTAVGSNTLVQADDGLGSLLFVGADGVDRASYGASIAAAVDGTPGANDMPGRLVFSTTADGASSPTEAFRITNQRHLKFADASADPAGGSNIWQKNGLGLALMGGQMAFYTGTSERLRIDSSGRLLVGTTTEGSANADNFTVADSGNCGITIRSGTTGSGNLYFSDATSGAGEFDGAVAYDQNDQRMMLYTASTERMRIDSSGRVGIKTTSMGSLYGGGDDLVIGDGGASNQGMTIYTGTSQQGIITFADGFTGAAQQYAGYLLYDHSTDSLRVATTGQERMRIDSSGAIKHTGLTGAGGANKVARYVVPSHNTNEEDVMVFQVENESSFNQITFGGGTSSYNAATQILFRTASAVDTVTGSERMRIDSSGRLLVGTSSDFGSGSTADKLQVATSAGGHLLTGRSDTTVTTNEAMGLWRGYSYGGGVWEETARISMQADDAHASGDKPGRLTFSTTADGASSPTERMRIDSSGRLLVGTSSAFRADAFVQIKGGNGTSAASLALASTNNNPTSGTDLASITISDTGGNRGAQITATADGNWTSGSSNPTLLSLSTTASGASSPTERMRIDSAGRVGIGLSNPGDYSGVSKDLVVGNHSGARGITIAAQSNNTGYLTWADGTSTIAEQKAGRIAYSHADDSMRFDTAASERMRIDSSGNALIGTTSTDLYQKNSSNDQGASVVSSELGVAKWQGTVAYFNRMGNDGTIINFFGQGTSEGSISLSGNTISYNGAHLSRWSQLPGGAERTEILRGSVLSNLDEMCEWGDEDNEQLNRMQVSDVEGDRNVAGVFQAWDDDDDTYTNDFYCAMTGDFVIRIAQGTTVARGDLLMSAGDGTAKPQEDDIIRSKTIAKVTSTHVSETYADGSYCVPCVLMAC